MAKGTKISWTHHTANFWWGCQKVDAGCKNCYAESLSNRYGKKIWGHPATSEREYKKAIWSDILRWDEQAGKDGVRRRVFISSMADFLEDHPQVNEWRRDAITLLAGLKNLDVLMLTKRPENAEKFLGVWYYPFKWPEHVWFGASVSEQESFDKRIGALVAVPSKVHYLSAEPLLGRIEMDLRGANYGINHDTYSEMVDWVIVGGESQPGCRPMNIEWARDIVEQCRRDGIAVFVKQLGGHPNPRHEIEDLPKDLQIREFPK